MFEEKQLLFRRRNSQLAGTDELEFELARAAVLFFPQNPKQVAHESAQPEDMMNARVMCPAERDVAVQRTVVDD